MLIDGKEFVEHSSGLFVSRDGEVYCKSRKFPDGYFTYGSNDNRLGYKRVCYKWKRYFVHRLVAETYIPNPNNYAEVDHIDRNPSNNNVENLRWANRSMQLCNRKLPNNNARSKPVIQLTKDGEFVKEWPSIKECGRNGFTYSSVAACCRGEKYYKTHKGYIFKYKEEELEEV